METKKCSEKAVVVSLQRQGNENKTTISLVNVEGLDFVVAVCSLLKVVDDLDLNEAVLKIASEMNVQITGREQIEDLKKPPSVAEKATFRKEVIKELKSSVSELD